MKIHRIYPNQRKLTATFVCIFSVHIASKSIRNFLSAKFTCFQLIFILLFLSAWISKQNIFDYSEFKTEFEMKNRTKSFRTAIQEIENEVNSKPNEEITLKNMAIDLILTTFDESIPVLEPIYKSRANIPNRFNNGNGLDYLTILYRTVTSEQQQQMYLKIVQHFAVDEKKYIENPTVSFRI